MNKTVLQAIEVAYRFPVIFTRGVFKADNTALRDALVRADDTQPARVVVYVDSRVAAARPGLLRAITGYFEGCREHLALLAPPKTVPGGEAIKNDFAAVQELMHELLALRLDRHAYVLAVGGGAVLDAVGFAAALVHRGLRHVRLPTTVLAQDDGGVGVKNAVNLRGIKNAIGAFAPPAAVINDLDFLDTLPDREWIDGIAEAFKVAIIKDASFFRFLCDAAPSLRERNRMAMEQLVVRCAELHVEHIRTGGDPFELGRARPLDFGHWSAHKLEMMTGHAVSHGQAVALGVLLDSIYAAHFGWLRPDDVAAIGKGLSSAGFPLWHPALEQRNSQGRLELLEGLKDFQEHLGGALCITMPRGIGAKFEVGEMDHAVIEQSIHRLKKWAAHEVGV